MRVRRQHPEREDARYLAMRREGKSVRDIALLCGVSHMTAWRGIQDARLRQKSSRPEAKVRKPSLSLTIAFGSSCKPLPLLTCDDIHPNGPMPEGTRCCCAACHKTGVEDHPSLRRDVATDPPPEPKTKPAPKPKPNRRQRRQSQAA